MTPIQNPLLSDGMDLHYYGTKLAYYLRRIDEADFAVEDKKLIRAYIEHCRAQGTSSGRLYKISWTLFDIKKRLGCTFKQAKRKQIEALMASINSSGYTANTRSDHAKVLKKFYKFVRHGNADKTTPYPAEVVWVSTTVKKNELKEPDVITEDEARRMIEAAPSTRDKALIAVDYEGGFRVGELLGMRLRDVAFDESGARFAVNGKTGSRTVRLITSASLLGLYVQEHPVKGNPEAALWANPLDSGRNPGGGMRYQTTRDAILRAAKLAGVTKRIHPHLFRHSAATRDASYNLSERLLEIKYGWVKGSRMAGRYTHIQDERVVDNALQAVYAGKVVAPPKPEFVAKICPKCSEKNTPGMKYCGRCGCPLDPGELAKSSVEVEELRRKLDEVLTRLEARK